MEGYNSSPENTAFFHASGDNPVLEGYKPRPLNFGRAVSNIAGFFGGLIAWAARNPMLALVLVATVLYLMAFGFNLPFGLGKSKGELRLERELAEAEAAAQQAINSRDAVIARAAQDAALRRQQIEQASRRGRDAIAAATPENEAPLDPGIVAALRDALDGLCVPRADGSRADPCSAET